MSTHTANFPEPSALTLIQHFLDGALIKDATSKTDGHYFKQKRIYQPSPKGMYIIEAFCRTCMLESETTRFVEMINAQPNIRLPVLYQLKRDRENDELIISQPIIHSLFRKFVGWRPNYGDMEETGVQLLPYNAETDLKLNKQISKDPKFLEGRISPGVRTIYRMAAPRIVYWLCENTAVSCPKEAGELAAHFILCELLVFIEDKYNRNDVNVPIFEATGVVSKGNTSERLTAKFRYTYEAIYAVTDEGNTVARKDNSISRKGQSWNVSSEKALIRQVMALSLHDHRKYTGPLPKDEPSDSESAIRLNYILDAPGNRILFREFLSERHCETNLAFWIDVADFKIEFEKAQKAIPPPSSSRPAVAGSSRSPIEPGPSIEPASPHESLGNMPFMIYNTYIAASGSSKLTFDIGEDLRAELESSLSHCVEALTNSIITAETDIFAPLNTSLDIDQLTILIWLYERIQNRVFARLADGFVPDFIKWPKYKDSLHQLIDLS